MKNDYTERDMECLDRWTRRSAITHGISDERLMEICNAERDGRVAILPPKEFIQQLGGEVYILEDEAIFEALLGFVGYTADGEECIDTVYALGCEEEEQFLFKFYDVGKRVFTTREEAEAALEKAHR